MALAPREQLALALASRELLALAPREQLALTLAPKEQLELAPREQLVLDSEDLGSSWNWHLGNSWQWTMKQAVICSCLFLELTLVSDARILFGYSCLLT